MVIFHSYVSLPEGNPQKNWQSMWIWFCAHTALTCHCQPHSATALSPVLCHLQPHSPCHVVPWVKVDCKAQRMWLPGAASIAHIARKIWLRYLKFTGEPNKFADGSSALHVFLGGKIGKRQKKNKLSGTPWWCCWISHHGDVPLSFSKTRVLCGRPNNKPSYFGGWILPFLFA